MANSKVTYTGDGSTDQFAVPFPFIDRTHVSVTVDGVSAPFSWISDALIEITSTPAVDDVIVIARSSSPTVALVDFTNGAVLREEDLDLANTQLFYIAQEAVDAAADAMGLDTTDNWDAENNRIRNVGAPVDANDAARKADVDAAVIAAGNVPVPANPADDGKALRASGGAFAWTADPAYADATTSVKGIAMLALESDVGTGTDDTKVITPLKLRRERNAPVAVTTSSTAISQTNSKKILLCSNTITVSASAASTLGNGYTCEVWNIGVGVVTIDPNGAELINGAATITLAATEAVKLVCDGTGFYAIYLQRVPSGAGRLLAGTTLTLDPFTLNSRTTQAHGLSAVPKFFETLLENKSAEFNFAAGDQIPINNGVFIFAGNTTVIQVRADATNTTLEISNNSSPPLANKTAGPPGGGAALTPANWIVKVVPYALST